MKRMYILAEYCRGPFYMGWWLYLRESNDGRRNRDGEWGWLRDEFDRRKVRDLCVSMGREPPEVTRHDQDLAEWFAGAFPAGLSVAIDEYRRYANARVVPVLPKQRRGVIRTVRGGRLSFAAAVRRMKGAKR